MLENILAKETISFKDLEEIAFKIACEFANEILRNMLEEYDKKIMDSRDTKEFRHKGKETTTVKAKTGLVEYTRTKYIQKQENIKNKRNRTSIGRNNRISCSKHIRSVI